MQRVMLVLCGWRNSIKLIKYFDISPRRFSPKIRPVCGMSHTVFKVVFDGVYISSTISLIWRKQFPIAKNELMKINFLCLLHLSKSANFEAKNL